MKSRFVILALVLAKMGSTAWGAEDPARFLRATNWYATFTHSLSENGGLDFTEPGTGDHCSATWHFVRSITVSCQLTVDPLTIGHPYYRDFNWKQNDSATVHISDTFDLTCTDSSGTSVHQSYTLNDLGIAPTNFWLSINTSDQTYSLGWVGVEPATTFELKVDNTSVFLQNNFNIGWSPEALSTNSLPSTDMVLQGQDSYPMQEWYHLITPAADSFVAGDTRVGGTSPLSPALLGANLVLTWSLRPQVEELEVVVQPEGYAEWTPEGNLKQPDRRGNTNRLSARLQKKGGGVPTERATRFDFELVNVSAEPGLCMNFPIQSPSTAPDLKFEAELNPPSASGGDTVIVGDDVVGVFANIQGMLTAHAVVSSFDFGAYGEIQVTAYVSGRDPIVGYLKDDPQKRKNVPLPKCQPGSHIADIWKERWGVSNLADEADDEDFPEGDEHPGDGYTLYEEYRGFCENRDHVRLIPLRKELFVRNEIEDGRVVAEIVKFKTASSLGVHYKLRDDEITPVGLMNVNHGHAYSGHPQSGIVLNLRPEEKGYSEAVGAAGALGNSTPGSKLRVEIDPAGPGWGLDLNTGQELYHTALASVAHEIAHCCSVWHHGDCDPKKRVWLLNPLDNQNYESAPESISDLVPIQPIDERGGPVTIPDFPGSLDVHLAVPQGQHSGDVNCFMHYRAATALRRDTSTTRVKLDPLNPPPRSIFCRSAQATGYNVAPRNLFGNAHAPERGNCAGQICVNDKYTDDEKHDRKYNCP